MKATVIGYRLDGPLAELLFKEPPADEIEAGPLLGWFGLYPNHELAGGTVLHRDADGFVTAWYSSSNRRLRAAWAEVRSAQRALDNGTAA